MFNLLRFALFVAALGYISARGPERKTKPGAVIEEREEFGRLSREKPADADVQSVADSVKSQLEKQLGADKVKSNKAINFRRMSIDMARPGGGLSGGVLYYIKVEIAPGKYVHERIRLGEEGAKLSSVEENHTLQDPVNEFFVALKEVKN